MSHKELMSTKELLTTISEKISQMGQAVEDASLQLRGTEGKLEFILLPEQPDSIVPGDVLELTKFGHETSELNRFLRDIWIQLEELQSQIVALGIDQRNLNKRINLGIEQTVKLMGKSQ